MNILRSALSFVFLLLSISVFAEDSNVLSKKVKQAHNSGTEFTNVSLFNNTTNRTFSFLKASNILKPDLQKINKLYKARKTAVSINLVAPSGKEYTLELLKASPLSANPNFGIIQGSSRRQTKFDQGLHYQGAVKGYEKSIASMSVFADGTVMIVFANNDGNFNLGALEDKSGDYILYNDRDMTATLSYPCGTDDLKNQPVKNSANKTTGVTTCRKVRIYWECDYALFQNKGSLVATQNYLIGLFNQKQTMYNNENIAMELSSLYIWTSQDFFEDNSSGNSLHHFQEYWNTMNASFDGDYAQLITRDPGGRGGVSYLNVLCSRSIAYGYADINGSFKTVPTYSWDLMVVTHETGHALGSRHTHWCGWNTGSGGSCGSIDDCYTQQSGSGCTTCPSTFKKSNTSWKGTVMSYCHLVSGKGIDLSNGFGPLPGNDVRGKVGNATCLSSIIDVKLTVTDICNNDGSVTLTNASGNFSDTPHTYKWLNGPATKDIAGIKTAGVQTVTVTDKNNCSENFEANVKDIAAPGDGKDVTYQLPICCKDTSFNLTLTANLPNNISSCQTVAWLRTDSSISSYAKAQTEFGTIGTSNILSSTNTANINNTTAATLDIASPNPCDSLIKYYYTPFITRKQKPVNTLTSAKLSSGGVLAGGSNVIGSYMTIVDQSSLATPCDLIDTPTTKEISITVSSYSGRPNNLTIVIIGANGTAIHKKTDYAGNGTYVVPLENNEDLLKSMSIQAMDFNCSTSTSCVTSTLTLSATRTVTYPAVSAITFDKACVVGKSVLLSFAPDNCFNLDIPLTNAQIQSELNIYPNPATNIATLEFDINADGLGNVTIVDVSGRTIQKRTINYHTGNNKVLLDVNNLAAGTYFVSMETATDKNKAVKLIIQ